MAEVRRGGVLKHPWWRGHPPDKWVKAAAHSSFLPTGRGRKIGTAMAFSDEVGALVASGVLRQGGKEEGAQAQLYPEKKAAKGGAWGSAHRGVGHDSGGGRSSGNRAAPSGELMHKWGEGGEGRLARETGAAHGGLPRWGGDDFGPRGQNAGGFVPRAVAVTDTAQGGQWDASGGRNATDVRAPHVSGKEFKRNTKTGSIAIKIDRNGI
jgi:hypothetical protein